MEKLEFWSKQCLKKEGEGNPDRKRRNLARKLKAVRGIRGFLLWRRKKKNTVLHHTALVLSDMADCLFFAIKLNSILHNIICNLIRGARHRERAWTSNFNFRKKKWILDCLRYPPRTQTKTQDTQNIWFCFVRRLAGSEIEEIFPKWGNICEAGSLRRKRWKMGFQSAEGALKEKIWRRRRYFGCKFRFFLHMTAKKGNLHRKNAARRAAKFFEGKLRKFLDFQRPAGMRKMFVHNKKNITEYNTYHTEISQDFPQWFPNVCSGFRRVLRGKTSDIRASLAGSEILGGSLFSSTPTSYNGVKVCCRRRRQNWSKSSCPIPLHNWKCETISDRFLL